MHRELMRQVGLACFLLGGFASLALAAPLVSEPILPVGMSLPVLLAAFSGAGLILSFLPPRSGSVARVFGTILFCTLLGAIGTPFVVKWAVSQDALFVGTEMLVAFIGAALPQILIPWVIDNRAELLEWLQSRFPFLGGSR